MYKPPKNVENLLTHKEDERTDMRGCAEFPLPREKGCFFPTSGPGKGLLKVALRRDLNRHLYGSGTIPLESF